MTSSTQSRRAWITIRFMLIIILVAAPRVFYNVYYLLLTSAGSYQTPAEVVSVAWLPVYGVLLCYYLNAVVVVWSNKSLHKWLLGKYVEFSGSDSADTEKSAIEKAEKEETKNSTELSVSSYQSQSDLDV